MKSYKSILMINVTMEIKHTTSCLTLNALNPRTM